MSGQFTIKGAGGPPPKVIPPIHYWSFNSFSGAFHNPSIPLIKADYSQIDTNKATIEYKLVAGASSPYAGYIDHVAGDTTNARLLAIGGQALRVRNPSDSMELRFHIPTTGFQNIKLKFAAQSSSAVSAQLAQLYDYSVDNGATWKTSGLNMTLDSMTQVQFQGANWGLVSINFGTDLSVNNNDKLIFRIKFAGNTALTTGNNRFDNITVDGDSGIVTVPGVITVTSPAI